MVTLGEYPLGKYSFTEEQRTNASAEKSKKGCHHVLRAKCIVGGVAQPRSQGQRGCS